MSTILNSRSVLGEAHAHEDLSGVCVSDDGLRPVPSRDHLPGWDSRRHSLLIHNLCQRHPLQGGGGGGGGGKKKEGNGEEEGRRKKGSLNE